MLIYAGIALVILGILLTFGERLPIRFGRLPGDIVLRGKKYDLLLPDRNVPDPQLGFNADRMAVFRR